MRDEDEIREAWKNMTNDGESYPTAPNAAGGYIAALEWVLETDGESSGEGCHDCR